MKTIAMPVNQPLPREQIAQMLQHGWIFIGAMITEASGSKIATPDNPNVTTGVQPCNIWAQAQPMMPVEAVQAGLVATATTHDGDTGTLDVLCQGWFGVKIADLVQQSRTMQEQALAIAQAQEGEIQEVA